MATLGQQKIDTPVLLVWTLLVAGAAALSVALPATMPWSFLALAVGAVMLYWGLRWEITAWAWVWVLSYGLLDWPGWKIEVTGFFNLTVPRLLFVAAAGAFWIRFATRRAPVRMDRAVLWAMLALLAYCAISATAGGWLARTPEVRTAPYFRFLGSLLLPMAMFWLVYNAVGSDRPIRCALILLTLYGWYALYVGYLQYAAISGAGGARALIWPAYINDAAYGIHFDRARGAFSSAGPQSVLMVLLFYVDLFLLRHVRGPYRAALAIQAVLVVPAIFFTGVRAAYVAFALCGVLWCVVAGRGRLGLAKLALAGVAMAVAAAMFRGHLVQTQRRTGGIAQRGPVRARYVLVRQTWQMLRQRPLTGVGFGHFVDAQLARRRDPAGFEAFSRGVLVQHNVLLNLAAETGLIGVALTVAVGLLLWRQSRQLYRRLPAAAPGMLGRDFVVLYWVALLNWLVAGMFRDTLWDVFGSALFWSLSGLMVGCNRLLDPQPVDAAPDGGAP